LYEIEEGLRANGLSEDEIKRALEFRRQVNEATQRGEIFTDAGWAKIETASRAAQNEKWFPFIRPWPRGFWRWKKYHLMSRFDPQPVWEKTTVPVLALYGELDRNAPAPRNAATLERYLRKAGNKDFTIIILPKANHYGMEAERGFLDGELSRLKRTVPGFLDGPLQWTLKHVDVKK
jgi:pimeloyl-ACP methyl ester carboxylesterase